jgi:DNA-binding NtrC family response regulator/tetratricopeptide (TPR) repeat protein
LAVVSPFPSSSVISAPVATPAPGPATFSELDERVASAVPGVIVVRAPVEAHGALAAHVARRLRTSGWGSVVRSARPGSPLFREVAVRLGLDVSGDGHRSPRAFAEAIAEAATTQRVAIVAPYPGEGTWDHAVATALERHPGIYLVLLVGEERGLVRPDVIPQGEEHLVFDVAADLDPAAKLRWFSAIAEEAERDLGATELTRLEAWWMEARRSTPRDPGASLAGLGAAAQRVARALALAGRSLSTGALEALASSPAEVETAIGELVAAGLVVDEAGSLALVPSFASGRADSGGDDDFSAEASVEERIAVAEELVRRRTSGPPDPWAFARAAELFLGAGDLERADLAIASAARGADPRIASEIQTRWYDAVRPIGAPEGVTLRVKAAQRALLLGEAIEAQRWCESAATLDPEEPSTHLVLARAHVQLGDLVAARVCLTRAEATAATKAAPDGEFRARIAAERAEISYLGGDLESAAAQAEQALGLARSASARLAARSTLGKILLARGAWDEADEHFAEDALTAATASDATAELRARLNRGIALLSKGQLEVARGLLERVLEDSTRLQEERARAFALSNLGLVAYRQRDYGAALHYWERTISFPQALRGRLPTALTIGNLADLRLRLGLVDHAEHALGFGRRLFQGSTPPRCGALFKWLAAQIALARGDTELARREVEGAMIDAQASGDRTYLESASVVAVRVALEDGDLGRGSELLERAEAIAKSPRARAEVAIVRAASLRARGEAALEAATEALDVARAAGEEDLLFEIHTLLAMIHRDAGDLCAAEVFANHAALVRDQVADTLPAAIRAAFLAKPDVVAAARLQAFLRDATHRPKRPHDGPPGAGLLEPAERGRARGGPPPADDPEREIIGDDPQIRSLAIAIGKVGRSNSTVLIRGESGTGKELVASALHRASERAAGPLVSVNCAALVETLLLSELFGHEKGAFTGASSRRRGRFELAEGGTLFLDEIGDISPRTQVALLRVLQEKTFERVGGTAPIRANVRVVCATHRDLRAMVERGEFREDLYYRLRQITLDIPALRARIGDVPKIADHLLRRIAKERRESPKELASDALDLFCRHRWPGNVRELENVLRAVTIFTEGSLIRASDVIGNVEDLRIVANAGGWSRDPSAPAPASVRPSVLGPASARTAVSPSGALAAEHELLRERTDEHLDEASPDSEEGILPTDEANATAIAYCQVRQGTVSLADIKRQIERDCIARALAETRGNITRAAALLGMKRPRLSQLVKQYGLSGAASSSEGNS